MRSFYMHEFTMSAKSRSKLGHASTSSRARRWYIIFALYSSALRACGERLAVTGNKMASKRATGPLLAALREHMRSKKHFQEVIHAYIIPTGDAHQVSSTGDVRRDS